MVPKVLRMALPLWRERHVLSRAADVIFFQSGSPLCILELWSMYIYIYIYVYACMYMHAYIYVYACMYMHGRMYRKWKPAACIVQLVQKLNNNDDLKVVMHIFHKLRK